MTQLHLPHEPYSKHWGLALQIILESNKCQKETAGHMCKPCACKKVNKTKCLLKKSKVNKVQIWVYK